MKKFFMSILSLGLIVGMFTCPGYATTIELTKPSILVDTYVNLGAGPNLQDKQYLGVGYHMSNISRAYLQFDISAVPAGNIITGATLTLDAEYYYSPAKSFQVYHVDSDAQVTNSMTRNNQPSAGLILLGENTVSQKGDVVWNLSATDLWEPGDLADVLVSLQVRATPESTMTDYVQFESKEYVGSHHFPKLTIEYLAAPPPAHTLIPGAAWLLGSGLVALVLWRKSQV
jgi:hypothetical protein